MTMHPAAPVHRQFGAADLLPRTGPAAGELLWGEPPRRQPVAPLVLMAVLLLLVAAPTALAGGGSSGNPITLMKQIAASTYEMTGLMQKSNDSLAQIDENSRNLVQMQAGLGDIAKSTTGMAANTAALQQELGEVGAAVTRSRGRLRSVDEQLGQTAGSMTSVKSSVTTSLRSTQAIVREFKAIDSSISGMDTQLRSAITLMSRSAPLTASFANNRTRKSVAGGDSKKYGVPNLAPDNRVMSVALGMLSVMQQGGALPARKDRHEASNPIVGTALRMKVPDGTNVVANVQPFDGFYGLPGPQFFVENRIHGF